MNSIITREPFQKLVLELELWREALEALQLTVTEDRPRENDVALADCYHDAAMEALGTVERAIDAARRAAALAGAGGEPARTAHELAAAHHSMNKLSHHHQVALAGWDRIHDLAELGRRRGIQWEKWALAVSRSLKVAPDIHYAAQSAIAGAWVAVISAPPAAAAAVAVPAFSSSSN